MAPPASPPKTWLPVVAGMCFSITVIALGANAVAWVLPRLSVVPIVNGMVVSGIIPLYARADAAGFSSVQFQVSGQPIGPLITTGICATTWDTRTVVNGTHTVTAVARDAAGVAVWASPVTVTVSNAVVDLTPPTVRLSAPSPGALVTGAVPVTAIVGDNVGVVGVWFSIDGAPATSPATPQGGSAAWTWITTTMPNGQHVIRATARDGAGNTATSADLVVTVRNAGSGLAGDFDADGYPDLLFQHTDGRLYVWSMNQATAVSMRAPSPASIDRAWRVAAIDDFNGDRKSDLLVQHGTTGQVSLWYLNGLTKIGEAVVQGTSTPWRVSASGDIDGDGDPDIIWRLPSTGQVYAWFVENGRVSGGGALIPGQVDASWQLAGAYDVNQDGRSDLVWQNTTSGVLYVWFMNGLVMTHGGGASPAGVSPLWRLRAIADFTQDAQPDFVWQHQTTGQLYFWRLQGTTMIEGRLLSPSTVDPAWQIVGGR